MSQRQVLAITFLLLFLSVPLGGSSAIVLGKDPGPWYFLSGRAVVITDTRIGLLVASNLPQGAKLTASVSDFQGEGSRTFSEPVTIVLNNEGWAEIELKPRKGLAFRRNMICTVSFTPTNPQQPPSVLAVVGKMGGGLGDPFKNPSVHRASNLTFLELLTVVR